MAFEKEYYDKNKKHILEYNKKYRMKNKTKVDGWNSSINKDAYQQAYAKTFKSKFMQWKRSANIRNIEWNLDFEYLQSLPLICHYTKERLTFERRSDNLISLDRINNSVGYIKGNVVLCSWKVNRAKHSMSLDEFRNMCRLVTENSK